MLLRVQYHFIVYDKINNIYLTIIKIIISEIDSEKSNKLERKYEKSISSSSNEKHYPNRLFSGKQFIELFINFDKTISA